MSTRPPLILRPPQSVQGQVPQVVYDYLTELYAAIIQLQQQIEDLQP